MSRVAWHPGGLLVEDDGDVILIDAPPGVASAVRSDLGRVRALVLTTGRATSTAGLLELLVALEAHRSAEAPLGLHFPLGEERGPALADVWLTHWPDRYPLVIDAHRPGASFRVGGVGIRTAPIRSGEPRWLPEAGVTARMGFALALRHGGQTTAVVLGAGPSQGLARFVDGADLAVIEVGVTDWPRTVEPWRLREDEAVALGAGARELWIVGDDGQLRGRPSEATN